MATMAGVALLVSALGIANTMLMSVLERPGEISIMKAMGADDRHLVFIFLIEGALIGLVGAATGLLLACRVISGSRLRAEPGLRRVGGLLRHGRDAVY